MFHHRVRINGEDIPDFALEHVFSYVTDPSDRDSISRVCKRWYQIEGRTRKDVTISCCYAIDPSRLTKRFSVLENVKLKGKPRASMFRLIPEDWGGHAGPWISEIALNCRSLQSLHLRRMILSDKDLTMLAKQRGHSLQVLKLDRCSGFSTVGIKAIASACRSLRVLVLDDSIIEDRGGEWLHELAISNRLLETLNFSGTDLQHVNIDDLLCVASNCRSLKSLKLHEINIVCLKDVIQKGTNLEELGGIWVDYEGLQSSGVKLPSSLKSLVGLCHMGTDDADITINSLVQPIAAGLKKIDLQFAFLSVEGHCELLRHCPNLEDLEVFNGIGDEGLKVISENCPKLRRLRIERGDREEQHGFVTQRGLIYVATHCHDLEYIAVYASDINNAALKAIADNCPKLRDFRLVLLDEDNDVAEYPLDDGVMALVKGCSKICRLALYLRRGFLSDKCMGFLGEHCKNLRWALFGLLGETDMGLRMFAEKCPNIEKLEMRDCVFTESGIAKSVLKMNSLKYIWVQGFNSTGTGRDLIPMSCESWNVEMFTGPADELVDGPLTFLAYRSLAGRRKDIPDTVICLG
ncbi:hypothetical protein KP509_17G050600 [Ceratopteris richardii]|uniref:Uncharacterized protein n=1 Tax=Ceratopteris richardii TaxID=49495 RepID=A0A8T2SU26_CERRI|nr:hypothetical protein KP509_17G050600 [Ceratopteris richardii]KAH7373338.1 hypothetical protein KP509_17G050600 [Ceratopteris richardii]